MKTKLWTLWHYLLHPVANCVWKYQCKLRTKRQMSNDFKISKISSQKSKTLWTVCVTLSCKKKDFPAHFCPPDMEKINFEEYVSPSVYIFTNCHKMYFFWETLLYASETMGILKARADFPVLSAFGFAFYSIRTSKCASSLNQILFSTSSCCSMLSSSNSMYARVINN